MELAIGIIIIAVLAIVALGAVVRSRQADDAVGMLSRETQKRDEASL